MPVQRLNHVVLYVRSARATADFYRELLGFRVTHEIAGGSAIFLQAPDSTNDHDLGLFEVGALAGASAAGRGTVGMYHIAWEVDTLAELERIGAELSARGFMVGASDHGTTKALYARDPDGLEFEVQWIVPADALTEADTQRAGGRPTPLDLRKEIARFGADRLGGVEISRPAVSAAT